MRARQMTLQGPIDHTYVWNGTQWSVHAPPPVSLSEPCTYDPDRQVLVAVKGSTGAVYEWPGPVQGWVLRPAAQMPVSGRYGFTLCYDPVRHRLVFAGGTSTVSHDDTWEFDGTAWQMIATSQPLTSGTSFSHARYVPEVGGIFATLRGPSQEYEHWVWDGGNWTRFAVARELPWNNNYDYRPIYDPLHGRLRALTGSLCDVVPTQSLIYDLEFRSLVPNIWHPRPGDRVTFSIEQRTQPNRFFGVLLSGSNYPGIPLPGSPRILPLRNDWILSMGLLPGLFGMLDAQGRASANLQILNNPALVGLRLHTAMVTLEATGSIGSVSNEVVLDINP